jgi:hypothetical protein
MHIAIRDIFLVESKLKGLSIVSNNPNVTLDRLDIYGLYKVVYFACLTHFSHMCLKKIKEKNCLEDIYYKQSYDCNGFLFDNTLSCTLILMKTGPSREKSALAWKCSIFIGLTRGRADP